MTAKSKRIVIIDSPVRNWGYLENWKSTASVLGSQGLRVVFGRASRPMK